MAVGIKKIWGSNYQAKKLYYNPGQYAKALNRSASDKFFNTQKAAISTFFAVSSENTYSSLEMTLRGVQQRTVAALNSVNIKA